jgi:hypothetical protein
MKRKPKKPRVCAATGKRVYPTLGAAIHAAIGSSTSFGKAMRYYRCESCKGYHLTSWVVT